MRCRYGCGPVLSVGKSGRWSFCEVNMRKRLLGFKWPRFSGLSLIYNYLIVINKPKEMKHNPI